LRQREDRVEWGGGAGAVEMGGEEGPRGGTYVYKSPLLIHSSGFEVIYEV
jgi:hypothetical protein